MQEKRFITYENASDICKSADLYESSTGSYCHPYVSVGIAVTILSFTTVIGEAVSGQLSSMRTGLVIFSFYEMIICTEVI